MFIRFLKDTNIRLRNDEVSERTLLGKVLSGVVIEVENQTYSGISFSKNDQWYRDFNGWYYWSGMALEVPDPQSVNTGPVLPPIVAVPPEQPEVIAFFMDDDLVFEPSNGQIPEGETRIPAKLTREEPRIEQVRGVQSLNEAVSTPFFSGEMRVEANSELENFRSNDSAEPLPVAGMPSIVNWGIRALEIPERYWKDKNNTGQDIRIAVLSTGIALNCSDLEVSGSYIASGCGDSLQDDDGTGTSTAVIVAGRGKKWAGVAPNATLLIAKMGQNDQFITPDAFLEGMDWALSQNVHIILMVADFARLELEYQVAFQEKINQAVSKNILCVAPVGNSSDKTPQKRFPAALEGVFVIGAADKFRQKCYFSARSYDLDLIAPGEMLEVVDTDGVTQVQNAHHTAAAAAFAAGCLALLIQDAQDQKKAYTPLSIIEQMKKAAVFFKKHVKKGEDVELGFGFIQMPESFS